MAQPARLVRASAPQHAAGVSEPVASWQVIPCTWLRPDQSPRAPRGSTPEHARAVAGIRFATSARCCRPRLAGHATHGHPQAPSILQIHASTGLYDRQRRWGVGMGG